MTYSPPQLNSDREVFDYVKNHLLTQGERAMDNGACLYRTDNGLMCAAGCLISDENYSEFIEGKGADNDIIMDRIVMSIGGFRPHRVFLRVLQTVHDASSPEDWTQELANVEKDWLHDS